MNELEKIYNFFPHAKWDYSKLSQNPSMTWTIFSKTNKNWVKSKLSHHPSTTTRMYEKYKKYYKLHQDVTCINLPFNEYTRRYPYSMYHPNTPINSVLNTVTRNTSKSDWAMFCKNKQMTVECALRYITYNWTYTRIIVELSSNEYLPDLVDYIRLFPWNMPHLSKNKLVTYDLIKQNLDMNWCPYGLSINPNLTQIEYQSIVSSGLWYLYAQNPNIHISTVFQRLDLYTDSYYVSRNPSITLIFMLQHSNYNWDFNALSSNTCVISDYHKAARIIQKHYLLYYYKPKYKDGTIGLFLKKSVCELYNIQL